MEYDVGKYKNGAILTLDINWTTDKNILEIRGLRVDVAAVCSEVMEVSSNYTSFYETRSDTR